MSILDYFPMILDVKDSYRNAREKGCGREAAVEKVREEFARELADPDDGPQVWIGLAEVTGRRKELTEELLAKAESAFSTLAAAFPEAKAVLRAKQKSVCDPARLGPEAKYRKKTVYWPDWKIGDTFAYQIKGEDLKNAGLDGWYIITRKIDERVLSEDCHIQVMYYSLCPPGKLPSTAEELERLGYVPLRQLRDGAYCFRGRLWIHSRSDEKRICFQKIGAFQLVSPPQHEIVLGGGVHFNEDQFPFSSDGAYFRDLELCVGKGYFNCGIVPCC